MAGKSGKCPGCGSSITVPEADDWLDDEDVYGTDDEWGGDSYDDYGNEGSYDNDNPYADDWEESSSPRRSAGSREKRKPKKKTWTPLKVGFVLGLGFAALNILGVLVGIVVAIFDDDPEPQFGQNNPIVVPNVNPLINEQIELQNRPEFQLPDHVTLQQNNTPPPSVPNLPPDNPSIDNPAINNALAASTPQSGNAQQQGTVQEPIQASPPATNPVPPPVKPLANVDRAANVWVVLSNLRPAPNPRFGGFNKPFLIDYQLASGSPAASGKYVLHLSKQLGGGTFYHTADVPIELKASGTVEFKTPPQFGPGADFVATIAQPNGQKKWKHVSGKLSLGGQTTAAVAPPSILEVAGSDARDKLVAIANPIFKSGSGPATLTLDFVLQQPATPTGFLFLVATKTNGMKTEFDIARQIRRAKVGDDSVFSGRLFGPGGQIKPPFSLHIEKRNSRIPNRIRPETPEIVSNKINIAS
jgi:hypothetical protein